MHVPDSCAELTFYKNVDPICDCSRSNQKPQTDQITEISPCVPTPMSELPYSINTMVLGVPYITANIYCKSRNLPNIDIRYYSIDVR